MICCPQCGARCFKSEAESERWRAIALALLVKHGGPQGHLLLGTGPTGSLAWLRENAKARIEDQGDAIEVRWDAPPLKPEGV